jgi:hypothetical protein
MTLPIPDDSTATPPLLGFPEPATAHAFRVINDAVMGGVSTSRLSAVDAALIFEGEVSLQNNGGFASFRGPVRIPAGASALQVTVRGDGKRYKLTVKLDDSNATAQYQAPFTAPRDWTTLRFAPGDFAASFRGRAVVAPPLAFGEVRTLGVLISERQAGPFRIELRDVRIV